MPRTRDKPIDARSVAERRTRAEHAEVGGLDATTRNRCVAIAACTAWIASTIKHQLRPYFGMHHSRDGIRPCSRDPRIETDVAAIKQKLDQVSTYLRSSIPIPQLLHDASISPGQDETTFTQLENSPFQLLMSEQIMVIFGLDGSFPRELLKVERSTVPTLPITGIISSLHS